MMPGDVTTMTTTESFDCVVYGKDVVECRERAWDALAVYLGEKGARDPIGEWVATQLMHGPADMVERELDPDTNKPVSDNDRLRCRASFLRERAEAVRR